MKIFEDGHAAKRELLRFVVDELLNVDFSHLCKSIGKPELIAQFLIDFDGRLIRDMRIVGAHKYAVCLGKSEQYACFVGRISHGLIILLCGDEAFVRLANDAQRQIDDAELVERTRHEIEIRRIRTVIVCLLETSECGLPVGLELR